MRLRSTSKEVQTSALVNSGYETEEPEIIIPMALARVLELSPSSTVSSYLVAGGSHLSAIRANEMLKVSIMLEDRATNEVDAVPIIVPGENEVIISDRLAHELDIVILDTFNGEWCLRDELGRKVRQSTVPQYWQ